MDHLEQEYGHNGQEETRAAGAGIFFFILFMGTGNEGTEQKKKQNRAVVHLY